MSEPSTLIRGGTLIVPDPVAGVRAIEGDLVIAGDRIVGLGPELERPPRGARVIYASGCAVLPGFVQTHLHLCHSLFRGLAEERTTDHWWRDRIAPLEAAHTPQSIRASARLAVAELLLGGTTAIQSMESTRHTEAVFEVLVESGLHALSGKALLDASGSPAGLGASTEQVLREAVDLAEEWDGAGEGRLRVCLSPHSLANCTDACLREVGNLAAAGGWRTHVQVDAAPTGPGRRGRSQIETLDRFGLTGSRAGLAHAVRPVETDLEILARTGTHVLHTASRDCKLGAGIAPVSDLIARGVRVSLGADGAASNNTLDMFAEMRLASLLQKATRGPEALPAATALDLATRGGAAAIGLEGGLGVLREGAIANVVLVNLDDMHTTPRPDPLSALVYSARASDVRAVWLAGEQVVAGGRLTLWDEEEVRREARREARGLQRRARLG